MRIADGQTVLLTGDSITDSGRARPVGRRAGLGDGYVAFVDTILAACQPASKITVLNTGNSGNRVIDLEARWQKDVLDLRPDWLSVMIGINDVWRQFDDPLETNQVTIERYETVYRKLLDQTRPRLKGLVLMTPYYIESNPEDPMRKLMDAYGRVVKRLAADYDAIFVNVQNAFDRFLAHRPTQSICGDRVHPDKVGHMILATSFLTAVGFDWNLAGGSVQKG